MKLLHLTNYWGSTIDPNNSPQDDDVDMDVIWTQALEYEHDRPCCPGFGRRIVRVEDQDLVQWDQNNWTLWFVSGTWGNSDGHYFYKFVLIPNGCYGKGKRTMRARGWQELSTLRFGYDADMTSLEDVLMPYWSNTGGNISHPHVHVGIYTMNQDLWAR